MRPKKYDEETKMISFRVPVSKTSEVRDLINKYLSNHTDFKVTAIKMPEVLDSPKPKWQIDAEERMKRNKV
jgi:hypothetical protein